MHTAALDYVASATYDLDHPVKSVIEIGSRDMNGSPRILFPDDIDYLGIDVVAGKGVDLVVPVDEMASWTPAHRADLVICCEVLEHVADFGSVLRTARAAVRDGGTLIVTAAGPGRRPHSGITGRRTLELGEYYRNVDPVDLEHELLSAGFERADVTVLGNDVRATARAGTGAPIAVAIPFVDQYTRTRHVIELVLADPAVDLIILDDNGSTQPSLASFLEELDDRRIVHNRRPPLGEGTSIYSIWNADLELTSGILGPDAVLFILNNDIDFLPGTIGLLAEILADAPSDVAAIYPNWERPLEDGIDAGAGIYPTTGAWSKGGLSGFAFGFPIHLVENGTIAPFDERYEWIYGDGDFVESIEAAGMTAARAVGIPLAHDKSTTANKATWTKAAKARDTERRKEKVAEREAER